MAVSNANVISGSAALFIAAETVAIPTLTGNVANFNAFTEIGYTQDGVEFDYSATDVEVRADEESFPVDVLLDKETASVSVKMLESTIQNLYFALTGATFTGGNEITFGGLPRPNIFRIAVQGPAPTTNKVRQIVLFRVYAKSAIKLHYKRTAPVFYQVQFMALADSTQPANSRAGIFRDF